MSMTHGFRPRPPSTTTRPAPRADSVALPGNHHPGLVTSDHTRSSVARIAIRCSIRSSIARDLPRLTGFVPNNILARVAEVTIDRSLRASDPGADAMTARIADKVLN